MVYQQHQNLLFCVLFVQIQLIYPQPGFVEMDEMLIWQQAQDVIKDAISSDFMFLDVFKCICTFNAAMVLLARASIP